MNIIMKNRKVDWRIVCSAIVGIVILEAVALLTGHNGTYFGISLALIAGLAGYLTPAPITTR